MILFCSKSWRDRIYLLFLRRHFDEKARNISLLLINICVIMKKIFTFAIMFAAVAMVACGGQTKKAAEATEEAATEQCNCEECAETEAAIEAEVEAELAAIEAEVEAELAEIEAEVEAELAE